GNVSIGTTAALAKLNVMTSATAALSLQNSSTDNYATTSVESYAGGSWRGSVWIMRDNGGNGGHLGVSLADSFGASQERLHIDAGGNVGIRTSSPSSKLHVEGGQAYVRYNSN